MILVTVIGKGFYRYAAAWIEQSDYLQIFGIHQFHQIFHDDVHSILVKIAMVAEAEKVEFQALALHHSHARDVVDDDVTEIGLAGFGTQGSEFRAVECHYVFIFRMFIFKCLQHIRIIIIIILCILVSQQGHAIQFFFVS